MFLLNNIRGREHRKIYGKIKNQSAAIFDISAKQLNSAVNSDWFAMQPGDLVCVVQDTYKMSTVYQIDQISVESEREKHGDQHVVRGSVIAKFDDETHYTKFLSHFDVEHLRLNESKFCIGFNIANLGAQLDSAPVRISGGQSTIGELKNG